MTLAPPANQNTSSTQPLWLAFGLNMLWINASEVFRYFAFVMPMMRDAFPMIPDVAPMNLPVFMIWAVWDTVLVASVTVIAWLALDKFGTAFQASLTVATGIWATIFVILWLGLFNMNLATPPVLILALVLAWIEMFVAVLIVRWCMHRSSS